MTCPNSNYMYRITKSFFEATIADMLMLCKSLDPNLLWYILVGISFSKSPFLNATFILAFLFFPNLLIVKIFKDILESKVFVLN